jgi:hypothetical protein
MGTLLPSVTLGTIDIVINPSRFVQSRVDTYESGFVTKSVTGSRLVAFYALNLLLYAGPLTLAGLGAQAAADSPPPGLAPLVGGLTANAAGGWAFALSLALNSVYLLIISGLTLATFHAGVLVTRNSKGIIQTLHTVVYSTGVYLAVIFTLTWYLSTSQSIVVADQFLVQIQKDFVYFFIDLFGAELELPGGRATPADLANLTTAGKLALTGLGIALLYYLYSLYLGARINHHADRLDSIIVIVVVGLSPALYVAGSILVTTTLASPL